MVARGERDPWCELLSHKLHYPSARTLSRNLHELSYSKRELAMRSLKLQHELQERLWTMFYNLSHSGEEIMPFLDGEMLSISLPS